MPKLAWNKFLDKYPNGGACIQFGFPDYAALQASVKRAKAKGGRVVKTGKVLPTPNAVIAKMAADMVKGDYTVKAEGPLQTVLFGDPEEAKKLAAALKSKPSPVSPDKPCTAAYQVIVNMDGHMATAKKLGLY